MQQLAPQDTVCDFFLSRIIKRGLNFTKTLCFKNFSFFYFFYFELEDYIFIRSISNISTMGYA